MSRPNDGSESHFLNQSNDTRVAGEAEPPTEPVPVTALEPIEKKIKWRQTFSLKGKGKEKADAHIELPSPISPLVPPFSHINPYPERLIVPPSAMPVNSLGITRRHEMTHAGHVPRPTSAMDSYVVIDSPGGDSDSDSFILVGREIGNIFLGEISSTPNQVDSLGSPSGNPTTSTQLSIPGKPSIRHSVYKATAPPLTIDPNFRSRHEIDSSSSGSLTPRARPASPALTVSPRSPVSRRTTLASIPEAAAPVIPREPSPVAPAQLDIDLSRNITDPNELSISRDSNNTPRIVTESALPTASTPKTPTSIRVSLTVPEIITHLTVNGSLDISKALKNPNLGSPLFPFWRGGLNDLHREYMHDGSIVAVKTMSLTFESTFKDRDTLERAARDLHAWSKCEHPNVIRLSGLAVFKDEIGIIYPWMKRGNIRNYLAQTKRADRCKLSAQ
ncbi:hypothetical protein FRC07_001515, partial [Ceratobasidium sp. 392]